ncbi:MULTISPECIES: hypothetical protein [Vibrio]|uniref:hypothetical protein n=1 Tax=Vibrio TaxID=662 RepID=UPI0001B93B99|nr:MULTISPECIES: hypothetical protein [Vibrio]EEX34428.1 hypothetical protein VIC_001226 [Vibrio coralliilyticus ATCC BAA-450]
MNYINSENKNGLWELDIKGIKGPILASDYLDLYGRTPDEARTASIKKKIVVHNAKGEDFIQCGYCGLSVRYRARSATARAAFYHKHCPELEDVDCPFHSDYKGGLVCSDSELHETQWHFRTKHFIAGTLKKSETLKSDSIQVEKFVFAQTRGANRWRKPDIYFEDTSGNRFAIELIQGWLEPEVIHAREQFFMAEGIHLIWLFSEHWSDAIFYYVMYGTALESYHGDFADFEHLVKDTQCNTFVFSEEALEKSEAQGELCFEAHFPEFDFKFNELFLKMSYGHQMVTLNDLALSHDRLPFAVNTQSALFEKQQALDSAIARKAQQDSQRALERIHNILKLIRQRSEQGTLSGSILRHLSDEITERFDYVLPDHAGRDSLHALAEQTIVREKRRLQEQQHKGRRRAHAKELRGFRRQLVTVRVALREARTIQELTHLRDHLSDVMRDYRAVIASELSSHHWERYSNALLEQIEKHVERFARDLPKSRPLWRITNDLLSYPLERRLQLFDTHSPLAIEMSQQLSAYLVNKSPQESLVFQERLNEIKRRTKQQYLNTQWRVLMESWSPGFSLPTCDRRCGRATLP